MNKILILCHDTIGTKMAGPGIRYQNIAEQARSVATVTLGVYSDQPRNSDNSSIISVSPSGNDYQSIFDQYDIIFAQWLSGEMLNYAKSKGKVVIIDLYAPVPIEYLASLGFAAKSVSPDKDLEFSGILESYTRYLSQGDFFTCSNSWQRDFWIGFMTAASLIKPSGFMSNPRLDNLALCPMGISRDFPDKSSTPLKLRAKLGLSDQDFVLLWTGGIWDWFDAQVIIKAVAKVANPNVKLVFLGTKHPNDQVYKQEMPESAAARRLSQELKLTNKSVFFLDGWVDYDDRASYFLDADAAIHADKESIETRFSHRTRVLDNLWAGLPTICNGGDYLAQVLADQDLGIVVAERTPDQFAQAIQRLHRDNKLQAQLRANIVKQRPNFTWEVQTKELLKFIANCQPGQAVSRQSAAAPMPATSAQAMRRVKNAIKVLIGRIDV